jgi:hypothetical protein
LTAGVVAPLHRMENVVFCFAHPAMLIFQSAAVNMNQKSISLSDSML